jgi:hypothetical protein
MSLEVVTPIVLLRISSHVWIIGVVSICVLVSTRRHILQVPGGKFSGIICGGNGHAIGTGSAYCKRVCVLDAERRAGLKTGHSAQCPPSRHATQNGVGQVSAGQFIRPAQRKRIRHVVLRR